MGKSNSISAIAITVAVTLVVAGCGMGKSPEERLDRARQFMAGDNFSGAIIELKNALQDDPVNLEARILLADATHKAGDAETAVKEYERGLDLGVDLEEIRLPYAEVLMRTGRMERALELADPVGAPPEQLARIHWIRGVALGGLDRFDDAIAAFDHAGEDADMAFAAQLGRARLELRRQDPAAARQFLDALPPVREQDAEYWETLALSQLQEGQPRPAVESLGRAIEAATEPFGQRRFVLRATLAEALLSDGDVAEARRVSERLYREARQHPLSNYLMSRVEYQSGNYQQALAYAQSLLSLQPASSLGNTMAGAASLAMNQAAQAESYLTRAVEMDSDNATARKLLAQTRLGLGSPQEALAALRPIAGLDSEAAALAGMASIRVGDPEAAIQLFRRELENDPASDTARMHLVLSLMAAGRNEEAFAELGLLKNLDDAAQVRADLLAVGMHVQTGALREAREAASKAADSRPTDPDIRTSIGAMFLAAGQTDDATVWFEDSLLVAPGNAAAEFNLGRIAAAAGQADAAEARFQAVLAADPGNAAAKTALAQVAWAAGRRAEAIRRLEEVRKSDRVALPPSLLLVQYLQAEGQNQRALEVAREAARVHPQHAEAANMLGIMLLDAGQPAEALRAFERAIDLLPTSAQYLLQRGRTYAVLGEISRARQDIRNALALEPEFSAARLTLVDLERQTGRLEVAAEHLARLKQDGEAAEPAVALLEGELLLARREYKAAVPAFEIARAGGMGSRAVAGLFQAHLHAGDPEPGRMLEEALRANPDDAVVRLLAADHYLATGHHTAAIKHYETLIARHPSNAVLLNNLAWVYGEIGDPRALSTAERAHQSAPESPMIMDTLGWILFKQGHTDRALDLIREAAERAPEVPIIRFHHAVLLAESGDREGALREVRALLGDETAVGVHADAQALLERLGH